MGPDLSGDVQAVCAVQTVAGTDSAGAHTLSRERLFTLFHLEGLAGARQHGPLQPASVKDFFFFFFYDKSLVILKKTQD